MGRGANKSSAVTAVPRHSNQASLVSIEDLSPSAFSALVSAALEPSVGYLILEDSRSQRGAAELESLGLGETSETDGTNLLQLNEEGHRVWEEDESSLDDWAPNALSGPAF